VSELFPVAPECVYVWRGFKPATHSYEDFKNFLGSVFVPACVLLQPKVGLRAYLPALVPEDGKPAAVPDQTALMFWNGPTAHDDAKKALAVRIYSNLHGDVYDMVRSKLTEVPVLLDAAAETLTSEQPYFLLQHSADWMKGTTHHMVCARCAPMETPAFLESAATWAKELQAHPVANVDAVLLCAGNDYLVAWVHSAEEGATLAPMVAGLTAQAQVVLSTDAVKHAFQAELWDDWGGLDLTLTPCLNLQFPRRQKTAPRERKPHAAD
jgi:hypothetical protein